MVSRAMRLASGGLLFLMQAVPALAHRPGESYVYLRVAEQGLSGEIHVRLSDLDKAVPLDEDGDARITPSEFDRHEAAVRKHFADRLVFRADGEHRPVFVDRRFFSEKAPQVALGFDLPEFGRPPDEMEVEYRFLYDEADPAHRPMLLFSQNPRMRLEENEAAVSLVFEPGRERQSLSLLPRPSWEIAADFVRHGMREIVDNPQRLVFALALLLPAAMSVGGGRWSPRDAPAGALASAAGWTAAFALGLAAMTGLRHFIGFPVGGVAAAAAPAASVILLAAHNFRPWRWPGRAALALGLGLLQGLGQVEFGRLLGVEKGYAEYALAGFGLGIWLGLAVVAAVVVPGFAMMRRWGPFETATLRYGSVLLALAAAGWFVRRTMLG
jgi:hypothetical protein